MSLSIKPMVLKNRRPNSFEKKHTLDLLSMTNKVSHGRGEMEMGTEAEMSGYGNENDKCDGNGSNKGKAEKKGEL